MTKLNWKLTCVAFLCWIVFLPIFGTIHEYGHAYACLTQGHKYEVHVGMLTTFTTCLGSGIEPTTYRMAGGFFGASASLLTYAVLRPRLTGSAKGVAIALVTVGITQFYNMVVETFANDFYMTSGINTGIDSFLALILLFVFIQRNSPRTIVAKHIDQSKYSADIPENIFKRSIVDIIKGRKPLPKTPTEYQKPSTTLATLDILEGEED